MPLLTGTVPGSAPGSGVGLTPVRWESAGTITATWTDPDGIVWPLSDISDNTGWFTTFGIAGWGACQYEIVTDPVSRGGESVRFLRAKPARITWPLYVWGETHLQFVQRFRALRHAFLKTMQRRKPGTLTVSRPDGTSRAIDCYLEDGWAGEAGQGWLSASAVLTLYAPDGAWYDTQQIRVPRSYGVGADYLHPYMTVSSSQVLGQTTIQNPGDLEAWPTWTITGPATQIVATNNTTGDTFTLTCTLTADQTVAITTLQPSVRGPAGENLVNALNWPRAYLWPLESGDNSITFTVSGGGVGTLIELAYNPRYEGA